MLRIEPVGDLSVITGVAGSQAACAIQLTAHPSNPSMPIQIHLDVVLAKNKVRSKELAACIGISEQNLSLLKSGKVKGIRFETLRKICERLHCQPGDILVYQPVPEADAEEDTTDLPVG